MTDKLYYDTYTEILYAIEMEEHDGTLYMVSAEALVRVHQPPEINAPHNPSRHAPIDTDDIIFV